MLTVNSNAAAPAPKDDEVKIAQNSILKKLAAESPMRSSGTMYEGDEDVPFFPDSFVVWYPERDAAQGIICEKQIATEQHGTWTVSARLGRNQLGISPSGVMPVVMGEHEDDALRLQPDRTIAMEWIGEGIKDSLVRELVEETQKCFTANFPKEIPFQANMVIFKDWGGSLSIYIKTDRGWIEDKSKRDPRTSKERLHLSESCYKKCELVRLCGHKFLKWRIDAYLLKDDQNNLYITNLGCDGYNRVLVRGYDPINFLTKGLYEHGKIIIDNIRKVKLMEQIASLVRTDKKEEAIVCVYPKQVVYLSKEYEEYREDMENEKPRYRQDLNLYILEDKTKAQESPKQKEINMTFTGNYGGVRKFYVLKTMLDRGSFDNMDHKEMVDRNNEKYQQLKNYREEREAARQYAKRHPSEPCSSSASYQLSPVGEHDDTPPKSPEEVTEELHELLEKTGITLESMLQKKERVHKRIQTKMSNLVGGIGQCYLRADVSDKFKYDTFFPQQRNTLVYMVDVRFKPRLETERDTKQYESLECTKNSTGEWAMGESPATNDGYYGTHSRILLSI